MAHVDDSSLRPALAALAVGEVVLLPVDTVPGLGVRADLPAALARLYALKGRPTDKAFALAFRDVDHLQQWVPSALKMQRLVRDLLPGPFTLVLPGSTRLGRLWEGWRDSVGVRIPGPCPCASLLESLPWPLAMSSANLSGQSSIIRSEDLSSTLAPGVAFTWPGESPLKLESTVLDLRGAEIKVLREGAVNGEELLRRLEQA